jgi:2-keto-4-pentenoate hydratase/2-oxohepta-3-ene-1,7-dioic acid hydratase in catechol pathway
VRIVAYTAPDGAARFGIAENEAVLDAGPSFEALTPGEEAGPIEELSLRAPVPATSKVVCVGLNYVDHAEESGQPIPKEPILFAKFPSSLTGHGSPIVIPPEVEQADYEAELAVVIGRRAKRVGESRALDHVLGYACLNDVSARDFQFADGQWVRGKSLDTFCPVGPWIVTTDELPDPQSLPLRCRVNGEVVQDSSTKQMVFSVAELVSFISAWITLEAGDVIATGTPSGVGFGRKPPRFLADGDEVVVEIEGIGALSNPVVKERAGGR